MQRGRRRQQKFPPRTTRCLGLLRAASPWGSGCVVGCPRMGGYKDPLLKLSGWLGFMAEWGLVTSLSWFTPVGRVLCSSGFFCVEAAFSPWPLRFRSWFLEGQPRSRPRRAPFYFKSLPCSFRPANSLEWRQPWYGRVQLFVLQPSYGDCPSGSAGPSGGVWCVSCVRPAVGSCESSVWGLR